MGLYIKGVGELPPGEYRMTLYTFRDGSAGVEFNSFPEGEDRFDVIHVSPHGRLIDGDTAEVIAFTSEDVSENDFEEGVLFSADWIRNQPTIIPAEEY